MTYVPYFHHTADEESIMASLDTRTRSGPAHAAQHRQHHVEGRVAQLERRLADTEQALREAKSDQGLEGSDK